MIIITNTPVRILISSFIAAVDTGALQTDWSGTGSTYLKNCVAHNGPGNEGPDRGTIRENGYEFVAC
jgi:hypothetical protein